MRITGCRLVRRSQMPEDAPTGLTLVEVLVAMAITAVAVLAALQLLQTTAASLRASQLRFLALACLDSEIARLQIDPTQITALPRSLACRQGGAVFRIDLTLLPTPHPNFRRLEADAYWLPVSRGDAAGAGQVSPAAPEWMGQRVYFRSVGF
ncbi:MAG: prepilin-type N-terminal cleavage/methylation domain-containing protein [Burkholderiaceae bacterium]